MSAERDAWHGLRAWVHEWPLPAAVVIFMVGSLFRTELGAGSMSNALLVFAFAGLFLGAVIGAFAAVRHAEELAHRFGEPYGTLILTIAVISIEVATIATIMLHGANDPHIARDTMYSVVMIVLNGVVGIGLIWGGLRHREQVYNLQGANAYLSLLIPLAILTMVWPNFTRTTMPGALSSGKAYFLMGAAILLYAIFLAVQTVRHRTYFAAPEEAAAGRAAPAAHRGWLPHTALLIVYLLLVVFTAKLLALPLDVGIDRMGLPEGVGALAIAVLVLAPEGVAAITAARDNHLQRSVNLALGSALATISLTVPAVLAVDLLTDHVVVLGLSAGAETLLIVTFLVSILTFTSGRTNVLQGFIHLLLFSTFVLMIFSP